MPDFYDVDKTTIKNLQNHRTIREFEDTPIDPTVLQSLFEAMNRTASANGLQQFSVIRVKDKALRKGLADVAAQEYLARVPELVIFIVDQYRNREIARSTGQEVPYISTIDAFFSGFSDALLAAQTLNTAVEAMGMGAVYFGSILNDTREVIRLLGLPQLTFPAVGLGFGHIGQNPTLKPRMPLEEKMFTDKYAGLEIDLEALSHYDEAMTEYYDLRDKNRRVDSFSKQVVKKFSAANETRLRWLDVIREQGFV